MVQADKSSRFMLDKKYLSIAGGLFLTAFLLVLVVFTSQTTQQKGNVTRVTPRASSGTGTVRAFLTPASNNLISVGATNIPVNVRLDPQGTAKTINGVQFKLTYLYTGTNPELEVIDRDSVLAGVQIEPSLPGTGWGVQTADQNYVVVDSANKLVTINFFATNASGYILNSAADFATIYLRASAVTSGNITLSFVPTLSKVYERTTGVDVLSSTFGTSVLTVTNDTVAPIVSITSGPTAGSLSSNRAQSFTFMATDDRSLAALPYAYTLSGPTPTLKTAYMAGATASFTGLTDGAYTFTVYAKDTAGNEGSVTRGFTVDGTVPTVSISSGPANGTIINSNTVAFTFTGTDNRTTNANLVYSYTMTGQAATAYSSSTTASFSNLVDGPYTFTVTSRDEAGNVSTTKTRTFTVNTNAVMDFKLKFEGVTATNSLNCPARNVRVTLKVPGTTTVAFGPVVVPTVAGTAGVYTGSLANITAVDGTYDVYLKGPGHLASKFTAAISAAAPVSDWTTTPLTAGDIAGSLLPANLGNPDNLIDLSDWQRIFNNISLTTVVDPVVNNLDLNCDKVIDTGDLQLIYNNVRLDYGPGGEE